MDGLCETLACRLVNSLSLGRTTSAKHSETGIEIHFSGPHYDTQEIWGDFCCSLDFNERIWSWLLSIMEVDVIHILFRQALLRLTALWSKAGALLKKAWPISCLWWFNDANCLGHTKNKKHKYLKLLKVICLSLYTVHCTCYNMNGYYQCESMCKLNKRTKHHKIIQYCTYGWQSTFDLFDKGLEKNVSTKR